MTAAASAGNARDQLLSAIALIASVNPQRAVQLQNDLDKAGVDETKVRAVVNTIFNEANRIIAEREREAKRAPRVEHRTPPRPSAGRWDVRDAPLTTEDMQPIGVILRWLTGLAFVAYSIITTGIIFGVILRPLIPGALDLWITSVSYGAIIGAIFAIAVTVGQWATDQKAKKTHWFLILALDAPFSAVQTYLWGMVIATAFFDVAWWGYAIVIVLSIGWGIANAKLGEKLLKK